MIQNEHDLLGRVKSFIKGEVKNAAEALQGARDIIAEWVNENEGARNAVRNSFAHTGVISAKVIKGKEEEGAKYRDYFDFSEPLNRCSSHRLLALRRGEAEGILRVSISPDTDTTLDRLKRRFVKGNSEVSDQVANAVDDSFKRLLKPSIETEYANLSKAKADEEAIRVFAENLRQLLLAPPLGQNVYWESIRDIGPVASLFVWMHKATCFIMKQSIPIRRRTRKAKRLPRFPSWYRLMQSMPLR